MNVCLDVCNKLCSTWTSRLFCCCITRSRRDLTWNLAKILGEFLAAKILRSQRESRQVFGRWDFEILARISTRFLDLGKFLAAEILRSHQDLGENLDEILRSQQESRRDFEISPRSRRVFGRQDLGNLTGQKLTEILGEISPRSQSKFCRLGWNA